LRRTIFGALAHRVSYSSVSFSANMTATCIGDRSRSAIFCCWLQSSGNNPVGNSIDLSHMTESRLLKQWQSGSKTLQHHERISLEQPDSVLHYMGIYRQ
jgi:hypothetical protein